MGKQAAEISSEAQRLYVRLGQEIASLRGAKGLTQRQLGDLIGESQTTISDYEKATSRVPLYIVVAIEDALGEPRGLLLREAGYVPDPVDVAGAIKLAGLTPRRRDEAISYYEYVRERSTQDAK